MHDRPRRVAAAGLAGLLLAAALAVPAAAADTPHPVPAPKVSTPPKVRVLKAEPSRVADYHPNRPITHDTDLLSESGYAAWMIDELLSTTTPLPPPGRRVHPGGTRHRHQRALPGRARDPGDGMGNLVDRAGEAQPLRVRRIRS